MMRPTQARTTRRNLVRSSGERFEEEEEVRSKSITGGHCIVWEWFFGRGGGGVTIEQRFSQFTVTGQAGVGMVVVMVPWSCLCCPAGLPAGHRFPITGSAVNLRNWV